MRSMPWSWLSLVAGCTALLAASVNSPRAVAADGDVAPPVTERFKADSGEEVPSFQKHVSPLFGRLGCNGRACHGSFQGRGGFRLSLFGYDFKADIDSLFQKDDLRVNLEKPDESLILAKPTDADEHEGGKRYSKGSWEHHLIRRWIVGGAKFDAAKIEKLQGLEISPAEILFNAPGEKTPLKVVARWADGSREEVTPLCRFITNNDQVCKVDAEGVVTAAEAGDTYIVISYDQAVVPVPVLRPVTKLAGANYPNVPTPTKVDELVVSKLKKLGIVQSELCDDSEFLRRIRLDMTGTLPAPQEVEAFLANKSANKRAEKVEELLGSPEYAAWWTTRLCDITGNNDQMLNNAHPMRGASREWYDWIYARVSKNEPYDKLMEGIVMGSSRTKDESYTDFCKSMSEICTPKSEKSYADRDSLSYYWARRNFAKAEDRAVGFAYTFLGIRIQCAQCHKHPFDQWSKQDFEDFKGFFSRVQLAQNGAGPSRPEYEKLVKELGLDPKGNQNQNRQSMEKALTEGKIIPFPEVYVVAPRKVEPPRNGKPDKNANRPNRVQPAGEARVLGGESLNLNDYADAREPLMAWLRDAKNPYFAKAFVNRVWANYFHIGIVNPPDDMSLANAPSNKALLDYLAEGFIASGFDMKWVHRQIVLSRTYQLSWKPNETNRQDETNFSHAIPRRLPAEVAYDAIQQATGSDEFISTFQKNWKSRSIAYPGTLNQGGRGVSGYALTIFGRSIRESNCDCDRSMEPSLLQTVYLQNDSELFGLIDRTANNGGWLSAQIAPQFKPKKAEEVKKGDAATKLKEVEARVVELEARLKKAAKEGNKNRLADAETKLNEWKKRFADMKAAAKAEAKVEEKPAVPQVSAGDLNPLVRQAYLRTLSRLPTAEESERAVAFVQESTDPVSGFRGLLWALVNTKEFIVNH